MRILTLTQPWASLVAIGAKRIETRSWATKYRGPIAIHAAKGMTSGDRLVCFNRPFSQHLDEWCLTANTLPRGAIVAVATLDKIVTTEYALTMSSMTNDERAFGNYKPDRYAWLLSDVRHLREPIACKGALGLRFVPLDVAQQLVALSLMTAHDLEALTRELWRRTN